MKTLLRFLLLVVPAAMALGQITPTTLPVGEVGFSYSVGFSCGSACSAQWFIGSGTLPPGLQVFDETATISGVPTTPGTYTFELVAQSTNTYTANLSITINPALAITTTTLPNGALSELYNQQISTNGGVAPFVFSAAGNLPPGLVLSGNTIQGTPTATGTYNFTLSVTDSFGAAATQAVSVTVNPALAITTTSIPVGFQGVAYPSTTMIGAGGNPPYSWSMQNAGDGLTIDATSGILSGTLTSTGQYTLNITLSDGTGGQVIRGLTLNVLLPLKILTPSLANGSVGVAYPTQTLSGSGGQPPYTWSVPAGKLPPGLTLNASAGTITGTPTAGGTYPLNVTLTDSQNNTTTANLSIVVSAGVVISPSTLAGGVVGAAYSQTLTATGGTAPYTWSVAAGTLPGGLTLNAATGAISGTPNATGTFNFTIQAVDSTGLSSQAKLSIVITNPPLTITTSSLPNGTVGTAYSQTLIATGGLSPYTWSVASGSLPAGLTLIPATGAITGTPTTPGTSNFTLQVTDSAQATVQAKLSIVVVVAPIAVTTASLPGGTLGLAYSQTLGASGGTPPYSWAVTSGSLPAGLTLAASTGVISGSPTASGTASFTVTVTDSANTSASKPLSIAIAAPTPPTVTITGAPATSGFEQQLPVSFGIGSAYPLNLIGTITLTFTPSVTPSAGVDDQMIQFSSGGRVINFTIPAGQTAPTLTGASSVTVLTGTTAGTITLTTDIQDSNGNDLGQTTKTIVTTAGVPFISSVSFQQTNGGVTVTVVGFSSTRDMVSGSFTFAPATNVTFPQPAITVPLSSAFSTWWNNTAQSNPYGTQFTLTVPFTTSTESVSVVSVSVSLTNSKGTSSSVSPSQ